MWGMLFFIFVSCEPLSTFVPLVAINVKQKAFRDEFTPPFLNAG